MISINFIISILPTLLKGVVITLAIAFCSSVFGFIGGTLLAIAHSSKISWLKTLVYIYVTIIRGTPMLLQIMFLYLLLPTIGIYISAFSTVVLAIGLNSSAYISQIIRAGIKSVSKGQIEAAYTLGISSYDLIRYIILPQALQIVIPALGNEFITLIKDSSLASLIGVTELYMRGNIIISQTHNAIPVYITIGLLYLLLTTILSVIINKIENKMNPYARS